MPGNASRTSMTRPTASSSRRPHSRPPPQSSGRRSTRPRRRSTPTSSEMRAPTISRDNMSRPSSSRPNGVPTTAQPGAAAAPAPPDRRHDPRTHDGREDCEQHEREADAKRHSSRDPRVEPPVQHVDDQVERHIGDRDEENAALHQRIVAERDRLDQQTTDPRPREDRLGDDRPGQHHAELEAAIVTTGIRLFRKACAITARARDKPRARAART